jgi:hypothetical protein
VLICPALKVSGMAIFPFILVQNKQLKHDEVLLRHETIHIWQQIELLVVPFYLLYLFNYVINRIKYKNHNQAYLNIIFEREAYTCESDAGYLKGRKFAAWLKFIAI